MVVRKNQFRCQGRCGRDWRSVWDETRSRQKGTTYKNIKSHTRQQDTWRREICELVRFCAEDVAMNL